MIIMVKHIPNMHAHKHTHPIIIIMALCLFATIKLDLINDTIINDINTVM